MAAGEAPAAAVVPTPAPDVSARGAAVRDEVELFGWPEQMLGCRHTPIAGAAAGLVICLSAPFESAVDESRAACLGRRLARAGVAVQRFHYRGSDQSDGDPASLSFASLVDDARRAFELLRERTGVERVGFLGARLGALVAARLGRDHRGAPVALWEPVLDPRRFVERAARSRAAGPWPRRDAGDGVSGVPGAPGPPAADPGNGQRGAPDAVPAAGGRPLDLFDTPLCADLVDGGAVGGLVDELGDRPGALLVAQTAPGDGLRPAYEALAGRCRARDVPVDAIVHACDGERDGVVVPAAPPDALVEATASWLAARLLAPDDESPPRHARRHASPDADQT